MTNLRRIWAQQQLALPDEELKLRLFKSSAGAETLDISASHPGGKPLTRELLQNLINQLEPGGQISLNGLVLTMDENGEIHADSSFGSPDVDDRGRGMGQNMAKSASNRPEPGLGGSLQGLWALGGGMDEI